ncbi:hypothetical protein ABT282_30910 [Streptomyces sp. NPDC000927]
MTGQALPIQWGREIRYIPTTAPAEAKAYAPKPGKRQPRRSKKRSTP